MESKMFTPFPKYPKLGIYLIDVSNVHILHISLALKYLVVGFRRYCLMSVRTLIIVRVQILRRYIRDNVVFVLNLLSVDNDEIFVLLVRRYVSLSVEIRSLNKRVVNVLILRRYSDLCPI